MIKPQRIIPAIIPTSADALEQHISGLSFAHEIQIDVVDGVFVPPTSYPYNPPGTPAEMRELLCTHTIEVDLMTAAPRPAAAAWVAAGADMLVFHIETITVEEITQLSEQYPDVAIGVSPLNDTPWEIFAAYLPVADYVQLMGIQSIGAQGAPFDERVLTRIAAVREAYPHLTISIDGSVNPDTIAPLVAAGADRLVVGSALLTADDWSSRHEYLEQLARPQT